jgi:hypothetical protein
MLWGLGFIGLGIALLPVLRTRPWRLVAPSLFALAGVCAVLDAPFRLDCASTISHLCRARGAAGMLSWREYGHVWASFVIEASLFFTPLALARSLWPGRLARFVLGGAVLVAVLLALSAVLGGAVGAHIRQGGHAGLWQRLWLLLTHVWVFMCAAALIFEARARPASALRDSRLAHS